MDKGVFQPYVPEEYVTYYNHTGQISMVRKNTYIFFHIFHLRIDKTRGVCYNAAKVGKPYALKS